MLNKTLLILIWTALNYACVLNAYGQSTEVEEVLAECEMILDEMATQRDRAIESADSAAQARDEARGQLLFLIPEYEILKNENSRLTVEAADKPNRWVWLGVGVGAGAGVTILIAILAAR